MTKLDSFIDKIRTKARLDRNESSIIDHLLDMKPSAIYMNNTRVYQKFLGLLKVMIDNYPVFERRLKKNKATYGELRHLAG